MCLKSVTSHKCPTGNGKIDNFRKVFRVFICLLYFRFIASLEDILKEWIEDDAKEARNVRKQGAATTKLGDWRKDARYLFFGNVQFMATYIVLNDLSLPSIVRPSEDKGMAAFKSSLKCQR